jgi:organic radical activating enzyme
MENYILKMKSPKEMRIICIDITNKCDLACSNCTRLLANQEFLWDMTIENFRKAVASLKNFPGIVILIGGNPCMHPKFNQICQIFSEERPDINKRGLWTNNFFKHEEISKKTFGVFNLNSHNNSRAIKSLKNFSNTKFYHSGNSSHAPLLTAIKDLYENKEVMWKIISNCDVNKNWSASIVQNNGKLSAYFCEVAASFDLARGEDNGIEVTDDWWDKNIISYKKQISHFCPGCGAAAKLSATKDIDEIDTYSVSNADLALKSEKLNGRKIFKVNNLSEIDILNNPVTSYSDKTKKNFKYKIKRFIWKIKKISNNFLNK